MPIRPFRIFVVVAYWAIVCFFLREASPIFMDGGGPMPSFYWGNSPTPELPQYYDRQAYYDFVYLLPYLIAGLVVTTVGMVAPSLLRRTRRLSSHPFLRAATATLVLLLAMALVSDVGSVFRLWTAPVFFLHDDFDFHRGVVLSKVFLPGSVLGGLVELGKRRQAS